MFARRSAGRTSRARRSCSSLRLSATVPAARSRVLARCHASAPASTAATSAAATAAVGTEPREEHRRADDDAGCRRDQRRGHPGGESLPPGRSLRAELGLPLPPLRDALRRRQFARRGLLLETRCLFAFLSRRVEAAPALFFERPRGPRPEPEGRRCADAAPRPRAVRSSAVTAASAGSESQPSLLAMRLRSSQFCLRVRQGCRPQRLRDAARRHWRPEAAGPLVSSSSSDDSSADQRRVVERGESRVPGPPSRVATVFEPRRERARAAPVGRAFCLGRVAPARNRSCDRGLLPDEHDAPLLPAGLVLECRSGRGPPARARRPRPPPALEATDHRLPQPQPPRSLAQRVRPPPPHRAPHAGRRDDRSVAPPGRAWPGTRRSRPATASAPCRARAGAGPPSARPLRPGARPKAAATRRGPRPRAPRSPALLCLLAQHAQLSRSAVHLLLQLEQRRIGRLLQLAGRR